MMVLTGEEKAFRDRAREIFRESYPLAVFYYFERSLYTKKRGWFEGALFPSYIFFSLDELSFFISKGEHWGISRVVFLPGQRIKAVSGPLAGYEGNIVMVNKKRKQVTVQSNLTGS